jgi:hypothetical protein
MASNIIGFLESPLFALAVTLFLGVLAVSGKFSQHAAQFMLAGVWFVGSLAILRTGMRDFRPITACVLGLAGFCFLVSYWIRPPVSGPREAQSTQTQEVLPKVALPVSVQPEAKSKLRTPPEIPKVGEFRGADASEGQGGKGGGAKVEGDGIAIGGPGGQAGMRGRGGDGGSGDVHG